MLQMSAATVDRYLKEERERLRLKGISTSKPGVLLRNSIQIRKAGDEMPPEPGFFEADTVAHCGPTLKGEFARSLVMTDVIVGWIHLEVLRNNAHVHIRNGLDAAIDGIPYQVEGLDCDNGSELINYDVLNWAAGKNIFFTRARPTGKMIRRMWSPRTITSCADMVSTSATIPKRNAKHWRSCGGWSA